MPPTAIPARGQRGLRVKLGGSILALVLLENGRQIRGRMSQLSVNGGLVSVEHPLDEGIRVTVLFHLGDTSVRCRAQMLFPMWATNGCLQPFRFLELPEASRSRLNRELGDLVRSGAPQEEEEAE
ncbi:MAG: PilZ domain-containing protein [Terriglobales bacterium]